jgi:serine/threonine protein kinase
VIERWVGGRSGEAQPLPALVGGRYRVLEKVGDGGMTELYGAMDVRLDRLVVLKVLREPCRDHEDFARSFEDGARALAQIAHPNVARVYDCDRSDGRSVIVMEYVRGRTLRAYLSGYALPAEEGRRLAGQLLAGLCAVHCVGITHTSVSPEDILVSTAGALKIIDLGIGTAIGAGEVGTPASGCRYRVPQVTPGHSPHAVGSIACRLLSRTLQSEPERWLDDGDLGIDVVWRTSPRGADRPPPVDRNVADAPAGRCLASGRTATPGIGGSDPTIAVTAVRADGSDADTVRFPTIGNPQLDVVDALHHTRPARRSSSLLAPYAIIQRRGRQYRRSQRAR